MVYMILKRTRGPDPPPWSISNSYNKTYNSYIRPSVTLPVLAQWFLSSSSTHCDTHILPTSSFATLNLSFVIYLKFSLPIMHKLSVISNHIFLCRQNPVFTSKTGVSPRQFLQFPAPGHGWLSVPPSPFLFKSIDTALNIPLVSFIRVQCQCFFSL